MAIQSPRPSAFAAAIQKISGQLLLAPGEVVQYAARLDRKTLAWGALVLAALLTLSANLIFNAIAKNAKADLTAERLYTISEGTKRVLNRIDEPISVRLYYTRKLGEVAPLFGKYFERVKALLEQYRDLSGGKVRLTVLEPEPFSDAEDRAVASGLRGVRLNQEGETGYFGLVASNMTDNDAVIEFFAPDRERFLEYDLTKLINGLANPKKRVVGLIAGIPVDGGAMNPMQPMRQPAPAWTVMEQIREFFEVRPLEQTITEVPGDIDVLMLAQPNALSKDAVYAIDQYVLRGGRVLAFIDAVAETTPPSGPMGMPPMPPGGDILDLLKAWGVSIDTEKLAGDPSMARRVQFGGGPGGRPIVTDYLAWLQVDTPHINQADPLAAGIERLNLASAGFITKVEGATTNVQPILQTSPAAGEMGAMSLRVMPDPLALAREFKSGGKPLMLAVRITGEAKTAYPDGRPKPEETAKPDEKSGDKPADAAAKPEAGGAKEATADGAKAAEAPKGEPVVPHFASGPVNVILIADSDLLHDQFWVSIQELLGQRIAMPQAHNAAFVINAIENLSGGEALATLRGRGINDRPFERVADIRREAERRYREKEQALNAKLKDLQGKLQQMETRSGEGGQILLSDKDRQTIEGFRNEMIEVRRELRGVQAELRRDIDRLDGWLKFFNIAAVPLLIGLGGIAVGLSRRRRQAPGGERKG
ncbi:MAG: Gldg family protein [Hyphomicrobiaceae bacterium]